MNINLIESQEQLIELIDSMPKNSPIAIDTEFVRRNTYYAKLSLFQICMGKQIYIVDCLNTKIHDLWKNIIEKSSSLICHAPRQDIEILYQQTGILPERIFDTQIAAGLVGFRSNLSYAELCNKICNAKLDKSHQNCNWLRRGITDGMMRYAATDVLYLEEIYNHLAPKLLEDQNKSKYENIIYSELLNPSIYRNKFENAWKRIRFNKGDKDLISKVKMVAFIREETAASLNIPKGFFLSDPQLLAICKILPINDVQLNQIQELSKYALRNKNKIFEICSALRDAE